MVSGQLQISLTRISVAFLKTKNFTPTSLLMSMTFLPWSNSLVAPNRNVTCNRSSTNPALPTPSDFKTYQEHDLRARQGLLQGLPITRIGLDELGAQVDEFLGGLGVGVARHHAGFEGAVFEDGVEDRGA